MKTLIAALLLLLPSIVFCQQNEKLIITHLTGNFYVYTTFKNLNGNNYGSNSMYLVTKKGVVLFDTPWGEDQFQPLLDSIEKKHHKKVILCISTHYHDDRTAGLEFYGKQGVKTYTSKMTHDLCRQKNEKQARFYFVNDTVFNVGGYRIETYYPGQGHTVDNIVIWCVKDKVLYGGCLVKSPESQTLGNVADANVGEWKQTIVNVMKKFPNPAYVVPGHMGWQSNSGLQHTIDLLDAEYNKSGK